MTVNSKLTHYKIRLSSLKDEHLGLLVRDVLQTGCPSCRPEQQRQGTERKLRQMESHIRVPSCVVYFPSLLAATTAFSTDESKWHSGALTLS